MTGVSLDTSGAVLMPWPTKEDPAGRWASNPVLWKDLSPFEHGYVEAALHALIRIDFNEPTGKLPWKPMETRDIRFSDLAPETLAAIKKDCAGLAEIYSDTAAGGANFWADRQRGSFQGLNPDTRFLPQTVTLGDDGKVRIAPVDGTTEHSSRSGRTK